MALSNAERQRRYRQKLRSAARNNDSKWASELRAIYEGAKADMEPEGIEAYTPAAFIADLLRNELALDEVYAILGDMLGVPRDPWPGLTGDDLGAMTKGRIREARARGIAVFNGDYELDYRFKLVAAANRDWLEGRVT